MQIADFVVEPLAKKHKRAAFSCGNGQLDRYLHEMARQHHVAGSTRVYVMRHIPTDKVAGFYTLSATAVETTDLPPDLVARLPHWEVQGAILIGQLARDLAFRGTEVGSWLLRDALERCLSIQQLHLGAVVVVVDAVDEHASQFYQRVGFMPFDAIPNRLYLPIATIRSALGS